jgi:hypothetical protein
MQSLNICGAREVFHFEFKNLSWIGNWKENLYPGQAHQSAAHAGDHTHVGAALIRHWGGFPPLSLPPPTLLRRLPLRSASLLPIARLTNERHPIQRRHRPSQPTTSLSSVEGVATPSSSSHRARCWVGLPLRPLLPPRVGCRRPPRFSLLRANWPHCKLPHCSPVLPDPRFYSGSH